MGNEAVANSEQVPKGGSDQALVQTPQCVSHVTLDRPHEVEVSSPFLEEKSHEPSGPPLRRKRPSEGSEQVAEPGPPGPRLRLGARWLRPHRAAQRSVLCRRTVRHVRGLRGRCRSATRVWCLSMLRRISSHPEFSYVDFPLPSSLVLVFVLFLPRENPRVLGSSSPSGFGRFWHLGWV